MQTCSDGIRDDLLIWLKSFLFGRQQCVVINNNISPPCDTLSGIPQGSVISPPCDTLSGIPQSSVIGPLLFLLYVNDVVDIFDGDVICKLYADDLKLYTVIRSNINARPLNFAHENLIERAHKWQLSVNIDKCNILHLGRQSSPCVYTINNTVIKAPTFINDLGVDMDSCLKFDHHISRIITKAYQRINLMLGDSLLEILCSLNNAISPILDPF